MSLLSKFETHYLQIKKNRWYFYFSIFCRITLAWGFFVAGMVKILDERFASGLSEIHPMGAYLEALHHTGYYYTFIGVAQIIAAILLLIPRTVVLGALLYLPIIVNIWILSFAVRFEGSFVTSPLMVLANLYLLVWNYDRLRYILPFKNFSTFTIFKKPEKYDNRFPYTFFISVFLIVVSVVSFFAFGFDVMPRNSIGDCNSQFVDSVNKTKGLAFCKCIHEEGKSLDDCLRIYEDQVN